jgi:hypothetical protein
MRATAAVKPFVEMIISIRRLRTLSGVQENVRPLVLNFHPRRNQTHELDANTPEFFVRVR